MIFFIFHVVHPKLRSCSRVRFCRPFRTGERRSHSGTCICRRRLACHRNEDLVFCSSPAVFSCTRFPAPHNSRRVHLTWCSAPAQHRHFVTSADVGALGKIPGGHRAGHRQQLLPGFSSRARSQTMVKISSSPINSAIARWIITTRSMRNSVV